VADEAAWDAFAAQVPAADVVVNNAGITGLGDHGHPHDPEHTPLEEWRRVHRVNLDGTFLGCRYAIRAMKGRGTGSIINISSRSGLVGIPGAAAYASSKAAIRNHTKSVALYCAGQGWAIRCNSIHPPRSSPPSGTRCWARAGARREGGRDGGRYPLKRFGHVEEVAALAVLLASDEATYITGSELDIDGGLLAGGGSAEIGN
jgi:NAD(P)-dependent dehydrogenase (short-subunit alcohol dehydrogenase family)